MKRSALLKTLLLATTGALLLSGCVYHEHAVYRHPGPVVESETIVTTAPPPPPVIVEERVVGPRPGYIWIEPGWAWRNHWVWERGHWDRPPHPGAVWVPHRYVYRNGAHVFVRGGWR